MLFGVKVSIVNAPRVFQILLVCLRSQYSWSFCQIPKYPPPLFIWRLVLNAPLSCWQSRHYCPLLRSITMREMFNTAFSAITSIFRTVDKFARSVEQVSDYTLDEATDFNTRSGLERQKRLADMTLALESS